MNTTKTFFMLIVISILTGCAPNQDDLKKMVKEELQLELKATKDSISKSNQECINAYLNDSITSRFSAIDDSLSLFSGYIVEIKGRMEEESPLTSEVYSLKKQFKTYQKTVQKERDSLQNYNIIMSCKNDLDKADDYFEAGKYEKALALYQKVIASCNAPKAEQGKQDCEQKIAEQQEKLRLQQIEQARTDSIAAAKESRKLFKKKKKEKSQTTGQDVPAELL